MHHRPPKPGTLAALAVSGRAIYIQCDACKHHRRFNFPEVLKVLNWQASVAEITARYRCTNCGKKNASLRYE